jgi:hypothetical protein
MKFKPDFIGLDTQLLIKQEIVREIKFGSIRHLSAYASFEVFTAVMFQVEVF